MAGALIGRDLIREVAGHQAEAVPATILTCVRVGEVRLLHVDEVMAGVLDHRCEARCHGVGIVVPFRAGAISGVDAEYEGDVLRRVQGRCDGHQQREHPDAHLLPPWVQVLRARRGMLAA